MLEVGNKYPLGVPLYDREELFEEMFGDINMKRKKNVLDYARFQENRANRLRKELEPPQLKNELIILYNFFYNYTEESSIDVKVFLLLNTEILL